MSTRTYRSPRRDEAARLTRSAILNAAEQLFVERGFGATTMVDLAEHAGVSLATVKLAFGTKRAVLEGVIRARVRGDDDGTPLSARPEWQDATDAREPERLIRLHVASSRVIHARSAAILQAVSHAAAADRQIAELEQSGRLSRWSDLRQVAEALAGLGALRPGIGTRQATDILWALNSPQLYWMLVAERRWAVARWEAFVSEALVATLLTPA